VQQQVEERKLDLAQGLHAAQEVPCRQHLVEQGARQRRAGVDMAGHPLQNAPLPAVVLHELRGQFDGVPFDAMDAGNAQFVDLRQQVVQAVPGLVEEGDHFVVGEGCRSRLAVLFADWPGKIAVEIGDRFLDAVTARPCNAGWRRRLIASSIQAPPRLVGRA
jgi:hypothetical protein